jgi:hypothetical protein
MAIAGPNARHLATGSAMQYSLPFVRWLPQLERMGLSIERTDVLARQKIDPTMFSSTAGGVENLRRFWANVIQRPGRP